MGSGVVQWYSSSSSGNSTGLQGYNYSARVHG